MKRVSYKVAKSIERAGYLFSTEVNEYFNEYYPYYMEVWLWLWEEKGIYIQVGKEHCTLSFEWGDSCTFVMKATPEDTIANAIEYLVENYLIK